MATDEVAVIEFRIPQKQKEEEGWLGNEPKFSASERNLEYALLVLR